MTNIKNIISKSIKNKLIVTVVTCSFLTSMFVGSITIYKSSKAIKEYANNELLLTVKNKSYEIDNLISTTENMIKKLEQQLKKNIDIEQLKKSESYKESLKSQISTLVEDSTKDFISVLGSYFVFSPELCGGGQGAWYTDLDGKGVFTKQTVTDITQFSKDDKEHVGWFYEASESQKGMWTKPYLNKNIEMNVISFVKAVYINNTMVGVVGMDFNFDEFSKVISNDKVNETGYFFLIDNEYNYLVHPTISKTENMKTISNGQFQDVINQIEKNESKTINIEFENVKKILSYQKLNNGHILFANTNESEVFQNITNLLINISIIMAISIVTSIVIAFILSNKLLKPVLITKEALEITSNFDLSPDHNLNIKSNDEIALMMNSLNKVRKSFRDVVYKLKNSSCNLDEDSLSISKSMKESSTAILDISKSVNDLADGAATQAKNVEESVNVLEGLAVKINEVTTSSGFMKKSIYDANEVGSKSIVSINKLSEEMVENTKTVKNIGTSIQELSQKSTSIGEITNIIKGIAYETNLLSLNAMIEGTKAGEYGRGFLVVAKEIKKLSYDTNLYVKEISDIVIKIQNDIENTKNNMNAVNVSNDKLDNVIGETRNDFESVLNSIKNVVDHVNVLENNVNNMNKDKNTVMVSIEEISAVIEEASAATQQISASIEEQSAEISEITKMAETLQILSQELNALVSEFKI